MQKPFVNPKNAGARGGYDEVLKKISRDRVCPFCAENLAHYHTKPILKTGRFWILTENGYPYKGALHHLLFIHRQHIENIAEISPAAWSELLQMTRTEIKKRAVAGGTFYLRFGNTAATGASVTHLHANLIAPDMRVKNREPILTRVG
ncbi:MAG: hypothetical protein AAB533_01330 [Patescibacteria group bacterium]